MSADLRIPRKIKNNSSRVSKASTHQHTSLVAAIRRQPLERAHARARYYIYSLLSYILPFYLIVSLDFYLPGIRPVERVSLTAPPLYEEHNLKHDKTHYCVYIYIVSF